MSTNIKLNVRVYPIDEPKGNTLAFANVGIGDAVAISGIRVIKGTKNNFVAMPQSQDKDGNYHDIAFAVNDTLRKEMNKAVLAEFKTPTRDADGQYLGSSVTAQVDGVIGGNLDVKAYPIKEPRGNTLSFANITVDNLVAISGVRVVNSEEKGLFVTMPQSKDKEGGYHDIAFPINSDLRRDISSAVLDAYNERSNEKTADEKQSMSDRLNESKAESYAYNAAHKADPARAAKGSPGLGD
jgi:stage V sporulation protein G